MFLNFKKQSKEIVKTIIIIIVLKLKISNVLRLKPKIYRSQRLRNTVYPLYVKI